MFLLLAAMAASLHRLGDGLAVILAILGTKMPLIDAVRIAALGSLGAVMAILAATMSATASTASNQVREATPDAPR
jgi:tellurite resistance protein TerC